MIVIGESYLNPEALKGYVRNRIYAAAGAWDEIGTLTQAGQRMTLYRMCSTFWKSYTRHLEGDGPEGTA
jgi:hypothetical protein